MCPKISDHQRQTTQEDIKARAREQMQREGTAAISLRAIARDMDVTAPALYRYFPRLDDLLTALILDAFNALADSLQAAVDAAPARDHAARLLAFLRQYRRWALENPVDFQLIYGNPIPGYEAPAELTIPAAARSFAIISSVLAEAMRDGVLALPDAYLHLPAPVDAHLTLINARDGYRVPHGVLYLCTVGWARIHGMIMLELFHHTQGVVGDTDAFYEHELRHFLNSVGMQPPA